MKNLKENLSKKHFIDVARQIKGLADPASKADVVAIFVTLFTASNPNFDKGKFMQAVGLAEGRAGFTDCLAEALSKKHFIDMAKKLKALPDQVAKKDVVAMFSEFARAYNPAFDAERFNQAAMGESLVEATSQKKWKDLEAKLKKQAKKKGLKGDKLDAYVYGTMRKQGWKPKKEEQVVEAISQGEAYVLRVDKGQFQTFDDIFQAAEALVKDLGEAGTQVEWTSGGLIAQGGGDAGIDVRLYVGDKEGHFVRELEGREKAFIESGLELQGEQEVMDQTGDGDEGDLADLDFGVEDEGEEDEVDDGTGAGSDDEQPEEGDEEDDDEEVESEEDDDEEEDDVDESLDLNKPFSQLVDECDNSPKGKKKTEPVPGKEWKGKRRAVKEEFEDEEDLEDQFEENPICPACETGEGQYMGTLGNRQHFRCRQCGMQFSRVQNESVNENDDEPVEVIFRKWKDSGDVIALFPGIPAYNRGNVSPHGTAAMEIVNSKTVPATPEEYAALKRELEAPPYRHKLIVRQRRPGWRREAQDQMNIVMAIMNGQSKISTDFGMKTAEGLADLIQHETPANAAQAIMGDRDSINTAWGRKNMFGLIDMIKQAKSAVESVTEALSSDQFFYDLRRRAKEESFHTYGPATVGTSLVMLINRPGQVENGVDVIWNGGIVTVQHKGEVLADQFGKLQGLKYYGRGEGGNTANAWRIIKAVVQHLKSMPDESVAVHEAEGPAVGDLVTKDFFTFYRQGHGNNPAVVLGRGKSEADRVLDLLHWMNRHDSYDLWYVDDQGTFHPVDLNNGFVWQGLGESSEISQKVRDSVKPADFKDKKSVDEVHAALVATAEAKGMKPSDADKAELKSMAQELFGKRNEGRTTGLFGRKQMTESKEKSMRSQSSLNESTPYDKYIGLDIRSLTKPEDTGWDHYWPVVDRQTMRITGIASADDMPDGFVLADLMGGRIVVHDGASDMLVAESTDNRPTVIQESTARCEDCQGIIQDVETVGQVVHGRCVGCGTWYSKPLADATDLDKQAGQLIDLMEGPLEFRNQWHVLEGSGRFSRVCDLMPELTEEQAQQVLDKLEELAGE